MVCNAWNHPAGCGCGFGGDTGGGWAPAPPVPNWWNFRQPGERLTRPTTCWWCGEEVFFHRDENGGCALFDELGAPWQVHGCWEEHRSSQLPALVRIRTELQAAGYDGRFYEPRGTRVTGPLGEKHTCQVDGFVADSAAWYEDSRVSWIRVADENTSAEFYELLVADSEHRLWPFLIRGSVGRQVHDYQLVRVEGVWVRHVDKWLLLATKVGARTPANDEVVAVDGFAVPVALTCSYCGDQLDDNELWGFDPDWRVECNICGTARGTMARSVFLSLCQKVSKQMETKGGHDSEE